MKTMVDVASFDLGVSGYDRQARVERVHIKPADAPGIPGLVRFLYCPNENIIVV